MAKEVTDRQGGPACLHVGRSRSMPALYFRVDLVGRACAFLAENSRRALPARDRRYTWPECLSIERGRWR